MSEAQQISLTITGMHCGGCVRRVTGALTQLESLEDVAVEVGQASFRTDDEAAIGAATAAVAALGFEVAKTERSQP